jgi:hypothetical protein
VRTTSDSGLHEQSQIVPAFGQPPAYHIRNFQDGKYWYVLRDTSWLMFISLATDRCRHNSHNERKWQATDIHQEEQRLPMSHTGWQLAPSPMRVHNIQPTIQGSSSPWSVPQHGQSATKSTLRNRVLPLVARSQLDFAARCRDIPYKRDGWSKVVETRQHDKRKSVGGRKKRVRSQKSVKPLRNLRKRDGCRKLVETRQHGYPTSAASISHVALRIAAHHPVVVVGS